MAIKRGNDGGMKMAGKCGRGRWEKYGIKCTKDKGKRGVSV